MVTLLIASMLSMTFNVATVYAKTIAVDGDPIDWAGVDPVLIEPDGYFYPQFDIKEVYITTDGNNIYFRIDFYGSIDESGYYRFFIDIDQDPLTGTPFYGIGADYQLGFYAGYGWGMRVADSQGYPVQAAFLGSTLELSAACSDLGNPSVFDFVVFCLPADDASDYTVSYTIPEIPGDQTITVDGKETDWTGLPFLTDDMGDSVAGVDLYECYVGSNGTYLFAMMNTSGPINPSAYGMVSITRISDSYYRYFYDVLGVDWIVWEGSEALSALGFKVGDEVYVAFTLMITEGDFSQIGTFTLSPKKLLEDLKTELEKLPDEAFKSSWFRWLQRKGLHKRISSLIEKVDSEKWLTHKLALWRLKVLKWKIRRLIVDPWETDLIEKVDTITEMLKSQIEST